MGELIHLADRRTPRPGPVLTPATGPVVSASCAALIRRVSGRREWDQLCTGLLAYEKGRWVHVDRCRDCLGTDQPCPIGHTSCPDPEPLRCLHETCDEVADIEVPCTAFSGDARGECCGCCWKPRDRRGMRRWTR